MSKASKVSRVNRECEGEDKDHRLSRYQSKDSLHELNTHTDQSRLCLGALRNFWFCVHYDSLN